MLTTENYAQTLWCPYAKSAVTAERGEHIGVAGINRDQNDTALGRCKGSLCMAWRWVDPATSPHFVRTQAIKHPEVPEHLKQHRFDEPVHPDAWPARPENVPATWTYHFWDGERTEQDNVWVEPEDEREARLEQANKDYARGRRGYCGAFGKPDHV